MTMSKPNGTGIGRIIKAARCSAAGIGLAIRHEAAFRQELLLTVLMIPLACWLSRTPTELILLVAPLLLLLLVECLNSAIEAAIDRIGPEIHPLSGQAKDLGSAAVFFAMLIIALCWGAILIPRWW